MSNVKWLALFGLILFFAGIIWLFVIDWQIATALGLIVWSQGINEDMKRRK